jgi:hypothetical protein
MPALIAELNYSMRILLAGWKPADMNAGRMPALIMPALINAGAH